ncbi:MAG: V-type ATP synthase subunit K [Clostridia bacterium]|nr:V-type ATP synthase subunit K [Clostridia bacterium]
MTFAEFFKSLLSGQNLAIIGAALAVIFPGWGSAKGVGMAGEALAGLMSEDSSKFGKGFTLQILPATQGLYGFAIAFIVMMNTGIMGGEPVTSVLHGLYYLCACLPMAVMGYVSAVKQARVAVAGINMISKSPEASGKALTSVALVELYALLALVISFFLVSAGPSLVF